MIIYMPVDVFMKYSIKYQNRWFTLRDWLTIMILLVKSKSWKTKLWKAGGGTDR